jgi:ATP-dependent Clp protease ATP-binding subunit ClpA
MPPFNNFTTKAKEVIRKSHELAVERGQNHVNSLHLLTALVRFSNHLFCFSCKIIEWGHKNYLKLVIIYLFLVTI